MLKPVVTLDARMTAGEVVERLAIMGYWTDSRLPVVQGRLQDLSRKSRRDVAAIEKMLRRDPALCGVAVRRQWDMRILWYARELDEVLVKCAASPPDMLLRDVLALHEPDSAPPIPYNADQPIPLRNGVVTDHGVPVAVSLDTRLAGGVDVMKHRLPGVAPRGDAMLRGGGPDLAERGQPSAPASAKNVWPRIDSPSVVQALKPFTVTVGFAISQQAGVAGHPVALPAAKPGEVIDMAVELSAGASIKATNGWSQSMRVSMDNATAAQVTFELIADTPSDPQNPTLTVLEVRYVHGGTVCGTASRPLAVAHDAPTNAQAGPPFGEAWQDIESSASAVTFAKDDLAPDLTIEITKTDRNASSGAYECTWYSPHALKAPKGPFALDLGTDAKVYAKQIVDEVRINNNSAMLGPTLEGIGQLIAHRLPSAVFAALREVAPKVAPSVPAVLVVSAEAYVPWELAWMDAPLDAKRPHYLGAQTLMGRWMRDPVVTATNGADGVQKPATHPSATMDVANLVVMAAMYKDDSGLRRLPKAEEEAETLATGWRGILLPATDDALRRLLRAKVEKGLDVVGADAVHFAGHGVFNPNLPEGTALFLSNGSAIRSTSFRAARYGGARQPLFFLNACMLGIGGEMLGDMGGFPGNSLRGGFGGVLGAFWEVDDAVAHDIALEFWKRALPPAPARGEPVSAILRDLRSRFDEDVDPAPVSTFLAYVYYGHPRLTLQRV